MKNNEHSELWWFALSVSIWLGVITVLMVGIFYELHVIGNQLIYIANNTLK